jgi:hypothetical protein
MMGIAAMPNLGGGLYVGPMGIPGANVPPVGADTRNNPVQMLGLPMGGANQKIPPGNEDRCGRKFNGCCEYRGVRQSGCTDMDNDCGQCPRYNADGNWCQACKTILAGYYNCELVECKCQCRMQVCTCSKCCGSTCGCGSCSGACSKTQCMLCPPICEGLPDDPNTGPDGPTVPPGPANQSVQVYANGPGFRVGGAPITCVETGVMLISTCDGFVTFGQTSGATRNYTTDSGLYTFCTAPPRNILTFWAGSASGVVPGSVTINVSGPH